MGHRLLIQIIFASLLFASMPTLTYAAPLAIINGTEAPEGQSPWMVGLVQAQVANDFDAQFCGGTLIGAEWVLTAAHCTYDEASQPFAPSDLAVVVGRRQLSSQAGERSQIDQIFRHPAFDLTTNDADIALLHLSKPSNLAPVVLSNPQHVDEEAPATPGLVMGWGITAQGNSADLLQQAELPIVPIEACRTLYHRYGVEISPDMLCAGSATERIDACVGDSGGPLLVWDAAAKLWQQIGVISWGAGCAKPGIFGVYTRVASFTTWIQTTTGIDMGVTTR